MGLLPGATGTLMSGRAPPNNGMHPTRDTAAFINLNGACGRVMPGVRLLLRSEEFC
jgi:hypothetical protein